MDRFDTHTHNEHSNGRGVDSCIKLTDLIDYSIEIGLKGIAITDHESLCGHPEALQYYEGLKKKNPDLDFKLVLGNEIYLVNDRSPRQKFYHCILLANGKQGYRAMKELSSHSWMQSFKTGKIERVPTLKNELEAIVKKFPNCFIATTACIGGELGSCIIGARDAKAEGNFELAKQYSMQMHEFITFMKRLFGENFYIEVAPARSEDQLYFNSCIVKIAEHYHLKMVLGTDAHYLRKEDYFIQEALLKSQEKEREVMSFYEYAYLQTEGEIIENLKGTPLNFEELCGNSIEIMNKIDTDYDIFRTQKIPKEDVKDYSKDNFLKWKDIIGDREFVKKAFLSDDIQERYYINQVFNELNRRGKLTEEKIDRVDEECDILYTIGEKLDDCMFAYTNTLQQYIDLIWDCGSIVGPGRGSACSWTGNYGSGITQIDPMDYNLYHWRFLNKERPELPDIDIDLCPSAIPKILSTIKKKKHDKIQGEEIDKKNLGIVRVATFGTETSRSAVHTAFRGFRSEKYPNGINSDEADFLSSLIPAERGFVWSIHDVVYGNEDKERKPVKLFVEEINKYDPKLLQIILAIEGLKTQRSTHASGVILVNEDPYEMGCYMKSPKGEVCTQWDLHMSEACGKQNV